MRLTTSKNCKSGHLRPKLFEASRNVYQKMKFFGLTSLLDLLVAEDYSIMEAGFCHFWFSVLFSIIIIMYSKRRKKDSTFSIFLVHQV